MSNFFFFFAIVLLGFFVNIIVVNFLNRDWRDGSVVKITVALVEDLGSVPVCNSSSGGSDTLWTPWTPAHTWHT